MSSNLGWELEWEDAKQEVRSQLVLQKNKAGSKWMSWNSENDEEIKDWSGIFEEKSKSFWWFWWREERIKENFKIGVEIYAINYYKITKEVRTVKDEFSLELLKLSLDTHVEHWIEIQEGCLMTLIFCIIWE